MQVLQLKYKSENHEELSFESTTSVTLNLEGLSTKGGLKVVQLLDNGTYIELPYLTQTDQIAFEAEEGGVFAIVYDAAPVQSNGLYTVIALALFVLTLLGIVTVLAVKGKSS